MAKRSDARSFSPICPAVPLRHRSSWTCSRSKIESDYSMKYLTLAGRILFAAIFILSAPGHFSGELTRMAAAQGVPAAGILVPLAGIIALAGGLSVLLG